MDFPPTYPVAEELYYGRNFLAKRIERRDRMSGDVLAERVDKGIRHLPRSGLVQSCLGDTVHYAAGEINPSDEIVLSKKQDIGPNYLTTYSSGVEINCSQICSIKPKHIKSIQSIYHVISKFSSAAFNPFKMKVLEIIY